MFKRPLYQVILKRLQDKRHFVQVLAGPRQSGKTTLVRQVQNPKVQSLYLPGT